MDFVSLNIRTLQIFLWLRLFGLLHEFTWGETFFITFQTLRQNSMFMMDSDVDNFIKSKLKVTNYMVNTASSRQASPQLSCVG